MGGMVVGAGEIDILEKIEEVSSVNLVEHRFFSVSYCTKSGANPSN